MTTASPDSVAPDPAPPDTDAARLARALMTFIRDFGLLQSDRTPCGQPLSPTQAHALSAVAAAPGITQRDLGAVLGLARATTSELITQLASRGWIIQIPSNDDRRQRSLTLTPAGQRVATDVGEARQALMQDLLTGLPNDQRARLIDAVELLTTTVRERRNRDTDQG